MKGFIFISKLFFFVKSDLLFNFTDAVASIKKQTIIQWWLAFNAHFVQCFLFHIFFFSSLSELCKQMTICVFLTSTTDFNTWNFLKTWMFDLKSVHLHTNVLIFFLNCIYFYASSSFSLYTSSIKWLLQLILKLIILCLWLANGQTLLLIYFYYGADSIQHFWKWTFSMFLEKMSVWCKN